MSANSNPSGAVCPHTENPLVIDLDGTLIHSDILMEDGMNFVRHKPFSLPKLILWLSKGKIEIKRQLAIHSNVDVTVLPYNTEVLELIRQEKNRGRTIALATATHSIMANKIAEHLKLFDIVISTEGRINLSGEAKRKRLVEEFGENKFDYAGNSTDDLAVWKSAKNAILVNTSRQVKQKAKGHGNVLQIIENKPSDSKTWFRALRIHQWAKNALIFVPLIASHQFWDTELLQSGFIAFFLFGLCASSVYLLNDLLDLSDDRHHATKKTRPFAEGRLSILHGIIVSAGLLAFSFTAALLLMPGQFVAAMASYYALTLAYSLSLKRWVALDVIALALLYTARIIAGATAFEFDLTFWILAFSMFLFLSLALVKRYAELRTARELGNTAKTRGRGYYPDDLEMISSLGASSGYTSVLILALYIDDANKKDVFSNPHILWLTIPLMMLWITRIWLLTHRGRMNQDPVVFALKDKTSLGIFFAFSLLFFAAI